MSRFMVLTGCFIFRSVVYVKRHCNWSIGMEIAPDGIVWATDSTGRVSGEAYVRFMDKDTTERALDKHMQNIGHRWGSFATFL